MGYHDNYLPPTSVREKLHSLSFQGKTRESIECSVSLKQRRRVKHLYCHFSSLLFRSMMTAAAIGNLGRKIIDKVILSCPKSTRVQILVLEEHMIGLNTHQSPLHLEG